MSKKPISNISHEYLEFEKSQNNSDSDLLFKQGQDFLTQTESIITPKPKALLLRFIPLALGSGFLSLFICPQYGLTPYNLQPHALGHLLHQNLFICGLYCGLVYYFFLSISTLLAFNHFEKVQFKKHYSYVPGLLCGLSWFAFMMLSHDHLVVNANYNLGWSLAILVGFGLSWLSKAKTISRLQY